MRDYCKDDFEKLWRIDQKCFPPGIAYSKAELSTYIQYPGAFAFVAESAVSRELSSPLVPEIQGFIVAEKGRRGTGHIITIDVVPEARRSRVGSRLMEAVEARLRSDRCRAVFLETAVDNASALAFYKRRNYLVVKTVPRYYSNGVDALVLEKDLLSMARPANVLP